MSSFNAWTTTGGGGSGIVETTGDIVLAVSPSGTDTPGHVTNGDHSATPYKTIQGALNVLPLINNHSVVINVAAGTYTDSFSPPALQGNGSLRIIGTMALATLTTGVNTGTISAATQNADLSWTVTKPVAAANWTAGNLRGKVFLVTGGAGFPLSANQSTFAIVSDNTTTTATLAMLLTSGVSVGNVFSATIDATTHFAISTWESTIDTPIPTDSFASINPNGIENLFSLEQLYCVGPGDETNEFCRATLCNQVHYVGNAFDGTANNGSAFFIANCQQTYAFGNYHLNGSVCNSNVGGTLWAIGLVGDHNSAIIASQISSILMSNNDFDFGGETHGDSAYIEATDVQSIFDSGAKLTNCIHNLYQFTNCPNVTISTPTVSSITGYALASLAGPTNISIDTKITGTAGNALLEDSPVDYSGAATGDSYERGLSLLTYTGP